MLSDVTDLLACPQCRALVDLENGVLVCPSGHRFDVARQGYVSLLVGAASKFDGDTADMIAARAQFLDAGHYDPLIDAVAGEIVRHGREDSPENDGPDAAPRVLEVGAGTGHYLAGVLASCSGSRGLGTDMSKYAARRIAKCHPRAGAVVADVWTRWPVRDGVMTDVLCVFAPRNVAESHRILEPGGHLTVLTPTDRHLTELVDVLGMVHVDERKAARLDASMSGHFTRLRRTEVEFTMALSHSDIAQLVGMGPSAHHLGPGELAQRVATLPTRCSVTASVIVSTYRSL